LNFALWERPDGIEIEAGPHVAYDIERNQARFGAARVAGPALVWELGGDANGAALAVEVELDPRVEWVVRCDRIDFPPAGVAYRHVHPGPGIRRLLFGELTIDAEEGASSYGPGMAWFEDANYPVLATASATEDTAFVRVMLLTREWEGKRTISYVDQADEAKPKRQRATILLEEPLVL
jgi:hypothetical protein